MGTIQIILIILFVGSSVVTAIAKKLREQRDIKRIQEARARQREEELRTGRTSAGTPARATRPAQPQARSQTQTVVRTKPSPSQRPVPTSSDDPKQRLKELAERRRAQLEELRRKQSGQPAPQARQQQARPAAQPQPQRRATPQPRSQPKQKPVSKSSQQRREKVRPTAAESRRKPPASQQGRTTRPKQAAPKTAGAVPARAGRLRPTHRTSVQTRGPSPLLGDLRDRDTLRRAIIMTEVLAPPVAMRKPGQSVI